MRLVVGVYLSHGPASRCRGTTASALQEAVIKAADRSLAASSRRETTGKPRPTNPFSGSMSSYYSIDVDVEEPETSESPTRPTLDPNTAHRLLSLSEDNRKVTVVGEDQSYPDHPDRFNFWFQVLGREALTGRCYWEVEREGGVEIGVTYRGITRRGGGGDSGLGENNKSWVLHCSDGRYYAWYNGTQTDLPLRAAGSTRVGVYLDRPAGSLSFYRVSPGGGGSSDTLTHLHTFWSSFTQEDLLPGVGVWMKGSSASLCRL
ncbi:unnamed protein product [Boreogadus saida]